MKLEFNAVWFLVILFIMGFHGCVIKAQRGMQVGACYELRNKNRAEFEACKKRITYFSALSNLNAVFHAWD